MTSRHTARGLVVVGFGAMASAIVEGALRAGVLDANSVGAADPSPERRAHAESLGCRAFEGAADALAAGPDAPVLLAVKPQSLDAVARDARAPLDDRPVISILAGATIERLASSLGARRIVRVMPNTPARVGRGVSAVAPGPGATGDDAAFVRTLFASVGEVVDIPEDLMDAFTAVCGSGPAYVFYLTEAMTRAAREVGFDDATADRVVRATVAGAAALLDADRERSASELRALVTSKGGTTAAATCVLDDARVADALVRAIVAARDRGRELAGPPRQ